MTQFDDGFNRGLEGVREVERDLLYIIAGCDESSGQAIETELQEYYDEEINHGRVYPNLDRLVDKGLVSRGTIDGRTNAYRLTDAGQRAIQVHSEWKHQHI